MVPEHLPPVDGSVPVVPGFVDFHAEHNPDRAFAVFPSDESPSKVSSVSFAEFARATHRVAHHYRPGRQGPELEVVAIFAHTDALLYTALLAGLIRAGIAPLTMSPKLSPNALAQLMKQTSAHRIITQAPFVPILNAAKSILAAENYSIESLDLLPLDSVYPALKSNNPIVELAEGPYPKAAKELDMDNDIIMYMHSSGSTGLPKPVKHTGRIQLQWAISDALWESRKRGVQWASLVFLSFHMTGFYMQVLYPLMSGQPTVLFAPQWPAPPTMPTPDNTLEVSRVTKSDGISAVPSFLEQWAQSDESIKYLATLKCLAYAGGPLSSKSGTKLQEAGVQLNSVYGLTECGAWSKIFNTDDSQGPDAPWATSADWEWFELSDSVRTRFVPQGDGTYELHYLTCETHQPTVENLPDVKGFATSDLLVPHPKKKGLWKIIGRKDDVIILSTAENIVPIPQESHLISNDIIAGAVMFGRGRDVPGVLIEPKGAHVVDLADEAAVHAFIEKIWPIVEEANKNASTYAYIFKNMIIITDSQRPLPRAPKGTVIRSQALALYNDDIERLYKVRASNIDGQATPQLWSNIYRKDLGDA